MDTPKDKINAGKFLKPLLRFAGADMAFYLLPPLMLLLVAGTLAQRWIGLWPAYDQYFASFVIWAGPVPLPGGYTLLSLLTFSLGIKFLFQSKWVWRKSAINLIHLGALTLLIGGLITSITAKEYFMVIPEGQETPYIYSYFEKSLSVFEDENKIADAPMRDLKDADFKNLPFNIEIIDACDNCVIDKNENPEENVQFRMMAQFMQLNGISKSKEPEADLSGITFDISGASEDQDGRYIAFDGMPEAIEIPKDGKIYRLIFGKAQKTLPFSIGLRDFVKDDYAGTDTARGYHSDITVIEGDDDKKSQWDTRIEMNAPLRYQGYTFFQSSFEQTPLYEITILAVVKNTGWLFPYAGSIIIGLGLLIHLFLILIERRQT